MNKIDGAVGLLLHGSINTVESVCQYDLTVYKSNPILCCAWRGLDSLLPRLIKTMPQNKKVINLSFAVLVQVGFSKSGRNG